jgi:hypothetical protein
MMKIRRLDKMKFTLEKLVWKNWFIWNMKPKQKQSNCKTVWVRQREAMQRHWNSYYGCEEKTSTFGLGKMCGCYSDWL